jgi:hypothetical protein
MSNAFAPNRSYLVSRPYDLLLLLRKVTGEMRNAFREHPDASVGNFDVAEDWCGVLVELALHGFISIGSDRGDVNQPDNAIIGSSSGDDGPPYEWPTRMAGLLTRPNVRFTVATSPSGVSRPYWAAITSYPSA